MLKLNLKLKLKINEEVATKNGDSIKKVDDTEMPIET